MKRLIYIAGPIAADTPEEVHANIRAAEAWAEKFLIAGWSVICPQTWCEGLRDRHEKEILLEADFEMVRRCDAIFLAPGWRQSAGTQRERVVAEASGLLIIESLMSPVEAFGDMGDPLAITPSEERRFVALWEIMTRKAQAIAKDRGWDDTEREDGTLISLMHEELGEVTKALRKGNGPDDHIPAFNGAEAEFADTVIRIFHMSANKGWRVGAALVAKMRYNRTRPHRHGGKLY